MAFKSQRARKVGVLGVIVAVHAGIGTLVMAEKIVTPQFVEIPMTVTLLPEPKLISPETKSKPLPIAKQQPVSRSKQPHLAQSSLEATSSKHSKPQAPFASNPEAKPVVVATAAEPVTSARFDAEYLKNPPPTYPAISRRMGEEGKVILRVLVNPMGYPEQVDVKSSSGSPRLDNSALQTVHAWKIVPAKRGDVPIESWVMVPINFKLES